MSEVNFKKHILTLEDRQTLTIGGISNVDAFNEEEIIANCDFGKLLIKGEKLHIEVLDLSVGDLKITGKVTALLYSEQSQAKGLLKRLLS